MKRAKSIAVVTGAGRGIGREVVRSLVKDHGLQVLAIARTEEDLKSLQRECGEERVRVLALDLALENAVSEVVNAVGEDSIGVLVNNAGTLLTRTMGQWTSKDLAHVLMVNAAVPFLLAQALASGMEASGDAHVVNIGSMGGFQGSVKFPGLAGYSGSKAALACLTECLAEEWKGSNIRCNCLCLGAVDTEMLRAAFPGYRAPVDAASMGAYIARFAVEGHKLFNRKVLPVSMSTP